MQICLIPSLEFLSHLCWGFCLILSGACVWSLRNLRKTVKTATTSNVESIKTTRGEFPTSRVCSGCGINGKCAIEKRLRREMDKIQQTSAWKYGDRVILKYLFEKAVERSINA